MMVRMRTNRALCGLAMLVAAMLVPVRQANAQDSGYRMLDLKAIVNMDWRDEVWGDGKGGWTDQGDTDMRGIEVGIRKFFGIPFEVIDPAEERRPRPCSR